MEPFQKLLGGHFPKWEVHIKAIVTCASTTLIVSPLSLNICLVTISIISRPKRDLYEHFFWQLTA